MKLPKMQTSSSDTEDSAFLSEALGFFDKRAQHSPPSPPVTCTGTVSKYFSFKKPRLSASLSSNVVVRSKPKLLQNTSFPTKAATFSTPNNFTGLVPVTSLPPEFAAAYTFEHFNKVQTECFEDIFNTDANMVVCAPTASGKTVLLEVAICRLFKSIKSRSICRVLYLAPLKALCAEKTADWITKFASAGLECTEATGEDEFDSLEPPLNAQIICATPEKWIGLSRRLHNSKFLRSIELVLVDECHMVGTSRGAVLELALLSVRQHNLDARLIAVSATVGNMGDISTWLSSYNTSSAELDPTPAKTFVFGDEYRPVPLSKVVIGYDCRFVYYKFQRNLDYKIPGIINAHCPDLPVIIFCSTRGSAQDLSRFLAQNITQLLAPPTQIRLTSSFTNKLLNESVPLGIGFHHAGLSTDDRLRIEKLFLSQSIKILCSTSTLGVGVNLPAGAVIVKGTKGYVDGGYKEYQTSEVLQFIGRAGRPQFGTSGKAIILTEQSQVSFYRNLVSGHDILESSLLSELPRFVLSGVYNRDFLNNGDVALWLQYSFLAVRVAQNPAYYGVNLRCDSNPKALCQVLGIAQAEIDRLCQAKLLNVNNGTISVSALGCCVAKYHVNPASITNIITNLPKSPCYRQVLEVVCGCSEFNDLRISMGQKGVLNEMNKTPWLRFKLNRRVESVQQKMLILIQFGIERRPLPSSKHTSGLATDMVKALRMAGIFAKCIRDAYAHHNNTNGVIHSTILCRELVAKCRESSPALHQQIEGIGPHYADILWNSGIKTIAQLTSTTTRDIEHKLNRNPPFGTKILANAARLPVAVVDMDYSWIDATSVVFTISVVYQSSRAEIDSASDRSIIRSTLFTMIVYTLDGMLLKYEAFELSAATAYYETQVGLCNPVANTVAVVEVSPEQHVGCSQRLEVSISSAQSSIVTLSECDKLADQLLQDGADFDSINYE